MAERALKRIKGKGGEEKRRGKKMRKSVLINIQYTGLEPLTFCSTAYVITVKLPPTRIIIPIANLNFHDLTVAALSALTLSSRRPLLPPAHVHMHYSSEC